jgi:hypothetical protein
MADTKKDDAASSIDPSPGTEEKPADAAAEIALETLSAFPGQGSAVSSARLTPTEIERPCSDTTYWNGNGVAHPEVVEGDVHGAPVPVPVPVPQRQGPPSFAQSEFYTVDAIFVLSPACPGLLICFVQFLLLLSFFFFFFFFICYCIDCAPSTS